MWKKTEKNKIPNPPSHLPGFRALIPLSCAVAEEVEPAITGSVLLEEFSPSVVAGDAGFGLGLVDVGLTEVLVEEPKGAVPEVMALEVVGAGAVVEFDMVSSFFTHR